MPRDTQIHELIAVENDAKSGFDRILKAAHAHFAAPKQFEENRKTYHADDEGDRDLPDGEHVQMQRTVQSIIDALLPPVNRLFDISLQKEEANARAKADLIVLDADGEEKQLAENVPVTVLVQLEGYLGRLIPIINAVPTLESGLSWTDDNEQRPDTWKAAPIERMRTKKIPTPIVKYDATDKHPAQTELVNIDKTVGKWLLERFSGALSETQKGKIVNSFQAVLEGVKRARSKANTELIQKNLRIGRAITNFIFE